MNFTFFPTLRGEDNSSPPGGWPAAAAGPSPPTRGSPHKNRERIPKEDCLWPTSSAVNARKSVRREMLPRLLALSGPRADGNIRAALCVCCHAMAARKALHNENTTQPKRKVASLRRDASLSRSFICWKSSHAAQASCHAASAP
eukprot:scaffold35278_cov33-Tisochrysis_lutea.AAC.3